MANMPVVYPPRGDYTTVGSELGNVGGIWLAGLLKKNKESQEDAKLMNVAKALEQADNEVDAYAMVGTYVQNGSITKMADIAKFYNLVETRFKGRGDTGLKVYNKDTGEEQTIRMPKKPGGITSDKDIEGLVGPNFTLAKPEMDEFYQENQGPDGKPGVRYLGKHPMNKRPTGEGIASKSEIDMREKLTAARQREEQFQENAIFRAERAADRIREKQERDAKGKEEAKPKEWEREAKGLLQRRGIVADESNMDKAVYVSKRLPVAERTLFSLAGGKIKENTPVWDDVGNKVKFGEAVRLLENYMWNGMNEYEAATKAWKDVEGGQPVKEKLDTTPGLSASDPARQSGPVVTGKVRGPDVPAGPAVTPDDKWSDTKPGTKQQDTVRGRVDEALKKVPPKAAAPAPAAPATPTVAPSAKPSGAPATRALPMEGGKALESQMKDGELYVIGKEVYKWDAKTRKLHKLNKQ